MFPFVETVCIAAGMPERLALHGERMNRTRQAFYPGAPEIDLEAALYTYLSQYSFSLPGTWKCRISYGREIGNISLTPYRIRPVQTLRPVFCDTIDYSYKWADRTSLNALFEQREGADEVLIVRHGRITDTTIANIALWDGLRWYTPTFPLLHGTRRASLIKEGSLCEKDIRFSQLGDYKLITLFNAMIPLGAILLPVSVGCLK